MKYNVLKICKLLKDSQIVSASLVLSFITCLVKLVGYAEKMMIANYWGTGMEADAYNAVFAFIMSVFIFFREIVEPGFMNVFLQVKHEEGERKAWNVFYTLGYCLFPIGLVISLVLFGGSDPVSHLILPGFLGEQLAFTARLMRLSSLACVFLILSTLTYITLNAYKRIAVAAAGDLVFKGCIVLGLLFFAHQLGIQAAIFGLVVGAIARLAVHGLALKKYEWCHGLRLDSSSLQKIGKLVWPLLIGILFSQVSNLVDNIFASYMPQGSISALSYAKKVVELPVVVFPYALSVVIFPYFSELHIEKDMVRLFILLRKTIGWIACVFIPLALALFLFADEITQLVFQRGAFDAQSTILTSAPLAVYAVGVPAFAVETVLVIFYFSLADTRTPVFVGIGCVLLNILVTWIGVGYAGYLGIAGSLVISKTVKVIILLYLLKYKFHKKCWIDE